MNRSPRGIAETAYLSQKAVEGGDGGNRTHGTFPPSIRSCEFCRRNPVERTAWIGGIHLQVCQNCALLAAEEDVSD